MKPKWIVFDIGGVILDWHNCRQVTLEKLNISLEKFNPVFLKYLPLMESGEITPEVGFKSIMSDLNLSGNSDEIYHNWQSNLKPIPSVVNLINSLSSKYKLAICSNTWINVYQKYNYAVYPEIFSKFSTYVDSSEINISKPDLGIYQEVEKKINSRGQDIFFIDDSAANILGTKPLNWQTFLFELNDDYGKSSSQELSQILL